MKNYRLVKSSECINKCESLGLTLEDCDLMGFCLCIDGANKTYFTTYQYGLYDDYEEITQVDFLALPEPLKVGDWCMSTIDGWHRIFKIEFIDERLYKNNTAGVGFSKDGDCTKLTPEQIKVLGLEE